MRVYALMVVLACVSACATGYGPKGIGGGYEDFETQPGTHYVSFRGNGYTSRATVIQYWHKRAAEICGGADHYAVVSADAATNHSKFGNDTTTVQYAGYGRYEASTRSAPTVSRSSMEGYIQCK